MVGWRGPGLGLVVGPGVWGSSAWGLELSAVVAVPVGGVGGGFVHGGSDGCPVSAVL